jgi:hypothetical protein
MFIFCRKYVHTYEQFKINHNDFLPQIVMVI